MNTKNCVCLEYEDETTMIDEDKDDKEKLDD